MNISQVYMNSISKIQLTLLLMLASMFLLVSCKKDESGPTNLVEEYCLKIMQIITL